MFYLNIVSGRVGYSLGAREVGSHEIFRLTRNAGRNSRVFVKNLAGKCFLQNEAKISCQTNAFLQKKEIFWCKSIITNRHFPQERKKFLATVRNFLPQEEISCHRKPFLSQEKFSYHRKFTLQEKNYLPEEIVWPKTFLFN